LFESKDNLLNYKTVNLKDGRMIHIRPLENRDFAQLDKVQPQGWVAIEPSFQFFLQQPFCFPFVAEKDGQVIGTANGIDNGRSAWISHIIVAPDFQSRGFGAQLTQFILHELKNRGHKTILLVASELGEKLYPRFGFETVGFYNFYRGREIEIDCQSPQIRSAMYNDLNEILALDKRMSGEDRSKILKLHIRGAYVYECSLPRRMCGFYLPTLGEGLVVAADNDAGIALFQKRLSTHPERIVVPQDNVVVNEYLLALGFECHAKAPRMVLGKNVKWRPRLMFSRVGGWYG
jgi:ribosomal protein S18 acetylase RimI-like enzyme